VQHGLERRLGPELAVQATFRITHDGEGKIAVGGELLRRRVKDRDLLDTGGGYLVVPPYDGAQVGIADGATSEAAQLQVNQPHRARDVDGLTAHGLK
jgi:hypothetical protein